MARNTAAIVRQVTDTFIRRAPTTLPYRPDIDGLRALAVIAVILYHVGVGCPGGYVGVDVFFVISGFLITSLVRRDLARDEFSFLRFWEGRVRRIVPALAVVATATLAGGWLILSPDGIADLGQAAAAQVVLAANVDAWYGSGYFAAEAATRPLLHTWTLAVEGQFYLVIPVILWALFSIRATRNRRVVAACIALIGIASFLASWHGLRRWPDATYYLLHSRAWELCCGSILALLSPQRRGRFTREIMALGGLVLIVVPALLYGPTTPFPGPAALPPCLGAALILRADTRRDGHGLTLVGRLCSLAPLVFIGQISYSLYLWHWPLLALDRSTVLGEPSLPRRASVAAAALPLAILSWRFVERPFRDRTICPTRGTLAISIGLSLVVLMGAGILSMSDLRLTGRDRRRLKRSRQARADRAFNVDVTLEGVRSGKLQVLGDRTAKPSVLVWGDSHAMALLPAMDALLRERGQGGRAATYRATPPVLGWFAARRHGLGPGALPWNEAVAERLARERIPDVVLAARWHVYLGPEEQASFGAALVETARRLRGGGAQVWIVLEVPQHSFDVPRALANPHLDPGTVDAARARPTPDVFEREIPGLKEALVEAGVRILDPRPAFLEEDGRYAIMKDDQVLYRDDHHLTVTGAIKVLLPWLREAFPQDP